MSLGRFLGPMRIHYIPIEGNTFSEMQANVRKSALYPMGDCILVWVNEGDFWMSNPVNVAAEDKERKEYERLRAKFESTSNE